MPRRWRRLPPTPSVRADGGACDNVHVALSLTYPAELPVSARREDIAAAIRDHQVVIVAGETGSGKTTQLPKICLELGRGGKAQIGHTQPRRIAARAVAQRIAEELGTELGDVVGYQVRFTDHSSASTRVKVMTDGILLAQIQRDRDLRAYDTLIIDEAHERSLNIDFLLGYLTNLLPRRPDLRVIITSATIDSERFAHHFAPASRTPEPPDASARPTAPVIEVTGRTYPVEIRYQPLAGDKPGADRDQVTGIIEACDELMREGHGDILVFLSGEREIRDTADALASHLGPRARDAQHPQAVDILALYSRLSAAEQHRVFESHRARRIVLATNVAETSLTVPGIHYVVDPGTARISRYSKTTKVQRLPIEPISQASAAQRAGRAGRLADGIAIRLYSQEDFEARPDFTEPEILRTSLASVLLQMIAVGVVDTPEAMADFPFVEPPETRAVRDGVQQLTELGALRTGKSTSLTPIGKKLARLPIDPRQARMIVEADRHGVTREVAIIAAALSIQDPRERPSEVREAADTLHRRFADPGSDLLTYLNLWEYLREQRHTLSGSAFRRLCKAEHLNFLRVREWQDVVEQIRTMAKPLGMRMPKPQQPRLRDAEVAHQYGWDGDAIHRSILAGLLSQVGAQDSAAPRASDFSHLRGGAREAALRRARTRGRNEYLGARGARFAIFPGSPLAKKPPAFVMAAELVETSRLWARDVAAIDPAWVEDVAGDLVKRTYADPRWSKSRGAAVATEKATLYGVPLVSDRVVLWGRIDPVDARDLFIRHALVQGEWTTHHRFWEHNRALRDEAEDLEARSRTRGLIVDDDTLFDFYDERVPETVVSARHFDGWWKDAKRGDPELLTMALDDVAPAHHEVDTSQFPDAWPQGDLTLPLTYQFEPGTDADGVTVHVPLAVLPRLTPDGFDWTVPGLADELATATIRALPKPVRRLLVPAPDTAREVVAWLARSRPAWEDLAHAGGRAQSYRDAFTRAVRDIRDVEIPAEAWEGVDERLPSHLRVTFRVEDVDGDLLDESTDLIRLQRSLAGQAQRAVSAAVGSPDAGEATWASTHGGPEADARLTDAAHTLPSGAAAAWEQDHLDTWPDLPDGALPMSITATVGSASVIGYPGLADTGGQAALRVMLSAGDRDAAHPDGVRRLLLTECALPTNRITTRWSGTDALTLASSPYSSTGALVEDLQRTAIARLTPEVGQVRDAAAYARTREMVRTGLEDAVHTLVGEVLPVLHARRELESAIGEATSLALLATLTDIREHTGTLVGAGFISATPAERLRDLPRYLKAATHRLAKAADNPDRDASLAWQVREVAADVAAAPEAHAGADHPGRAERERAQWLVEELRVSLFAQHLGTSEAVSAKRIRALVTG